MNEDLKNQATDAVDATEGEIPNSAPVNSIESQSRVRKNDKGYIRLKVSKTKTDEDVPVWDQISNFHMRLVRVERHADEEATTVQRVIELVDPSTGYRREVIVQPKELVGEYNFNTWLLAQGNFDWRGTPADVKTILSGLWAQATVEVFLKNIAGYEKGTGTWIFQNGAITKDGKVYLYDEQKTCIDIDGLKYRLAINEQDSTINRAPVMDFKVDPVKSKELLRKIIANTIELWGPGAETAWAWALSHLWRSRWLSEAAQFPLLMVIGTPSLGKTQFIQLMVLKLYGLMYEPLSMKQASEVGVYNLINQMSNIPVFLDEFRGEMVNNSETFEFLKGNADGAGKIVGSLSTFKTKTRPHRTGLIICGETRTPNEALDSRSINCDLVKKENVALYEDTVRMCRKLPGVLVSVIQQWDDLWKLIWDRKDVLLKQWRIASPKTDSRIVLNYAKVCSAMDVILPDETRAERFLSLMVTKGEETQEKNELAKMLARMPYMVENERAFIPCRYNAKKRRFAVNAAYLIQSYAGSTRSTPQSSTELIRYGKSCGLLIPMHRPITQGVEIEQLNREQKKVMVMNKCFLFDATHPTVSEVVSKLGIMDKSETRDSLQPDANNPDDPFMPE